MRPRTDTQTNRHTRRHTDARDHNTFLVVYDSREMQRTALYMARIFIVFDQGHGKSDCTRCLAFKRPAIDE